MGWSRCREDSGQHRPAPALPASSASLDGSTPGVHFTGYAKQTGAITQHYAYDAMNRLSMVSTGAYAARIPNGSNMAPIPLGSSQAIVLDRRYYDSASRVVQTGPGGSLPADYLKALVGANLDLSGASTVTSRYDAAGRVLVQHSVNETLAASDPARVRDTEYSHVVTSSHQEQTDVDESGAPVYTTVTTTSRSSGYDAAGNLRFTHSVAGSSQGTVVTDTEIALRTLEGYKQQGTHTVNTNLDSGHVTEGSTALFYSANNQLVGVDDSTSPVSSRRLVNDASGHVLLNTQGNPSVGVHRLRELVVAGEVLGIYGSGVDRSNPQDDQGNPMFTEQGDFNPAYRPVTGSYPAAATGQYPVRAGDTLRSIAQAAYGDADIWYEIASANGLSNDSELRVGQVLNIPTKVGGVHNSASTFAPYDPSRIVGSTEPQQLAMPAGNQDDDDCGGIGQVIMIAIAVAVTVYSAGALSGATGTFLEVAAAGSEALAGAGTLSFAGAALAGAAGSVASQVVGNAIGAQDGFSWKQVALAAVSAGVTQGVGSANVLPNLGSTFGNAALITAVSSAVSQGISVSLGLQDRFSWTQVAASAVGAGVGAQINSAMNYNPQVNGFDLGKSVLSATGAALTTAVMRGGRVSVTQVATDAFGNALGQSLAYSNGQTSGAGSGTQEDRLGTFIQNNTDRDQNIARMLDLANRPESVGTWAGMGGGLGEGSRSDNGFGFIDEVRSATTGPVEMNEGRAVGTPLPPSPYQWVPNQWVGREVGYLVPGHWVDTGNAPERGVLVDAQASSNAFYTDRIADASNPFAAVSYTLGRAANNAGYDIANGVAALYNLATDAQTRANLIVAGVNTIAHPFDTGTALYGAGAKYVGGLKSEVQHPHPG